MRRHFSTCLSHRCRADTASPRGVPRCFRLISSLLYARHAAAPAATLCAFRGAAESRCSAASAAMRRRYAGCRERPRLLRELPPPFRVKHCRFQMPAAARAPIFAQRCRQRVRLQLFPAASFSADTPEPHAAVLSPPLRERAAAADGASQFSRYYCRLRASFCRTFSIAAAFSTPPFLPPPPSRAGFRLQVTPC